MTSPGQGSEYKDRFGFRFKFRFRFRFGFRFRFRVGFRLQFRFRFSVGFGYRFRFWFRFRFRLKSDTGSDSGTGSGLGSNTYIDSFTTVWCAAFGHAVSCHLASWRVPLHSMSSLPRWDHISVGRTPKRGARCPSSGPPHHPEQPHSLSHSSGLPHPDPAHPTPSHHDSSTQPVEPKGRPTRCYWRHNFKSHLADEYRTMYFILELCTQLPCRSNEYETWEHSTCSQVWESPQYNRNKITSVTGGRYDR